MATPLSIHAFLGGARVPYGLLPHAPAFSSQREAASLHVSGRGWAKVVVCIADGTPIQAVLQAHQIVDLEHLRLLAGARRIRLASEDEIAALYPDCELGAMPPLGTLYGHRVFVDTALAQQPEIYFDAGTHRDAIWMWYESFDTAVHPHVGTFARPRAAISA